MTVRSKSRKAPKTKKLVAATEAIERAVVVPPVSVTVMCRPTSPNEGTMESTVYGYEAVKRRFEIRHPNVGFHEIADELRKVADILVSRTGNRKPYGRATIVVLWNEK